MIGFDLDAAVEMHVKMMDNGEISGDDMDNWFMLVHCAVHYGESK